MKTLFKIFITIFALTTIFANEPQLSINNAILTKVNGKTISVMDVMKKMDFVFHKSYPDLIDSKTARYQFYTSSWQHMLKELVNTELMTAQAEVREVKISDGELREEMEDRFGPNTILTLEKLGLSYNEAAEMLKTEMIVRRMMWFFVHSKALAKVTPQSIKNGYKNYLEKNPPFEEWEYQIITIKGKEESAASVAETAHQALTQNKNFDILEELEKKYPEHKFQISSVYKLNSKEMSTLHKNILTSLNPGEYAQPTRQKSQYKIFYLKNKEKHNPPSFDEMADNIKDDLLQNAVAEESDSYFKKLYKYYGIKEDALVPQDFEPFVLK